MSAMAAILLVDLAVILAVVSGLWLLSLAIADASIVDPFWGVGFVIVAWATWFQDAHRTWYDGLLLAMVTAWGVRLSAYLLWRNAGKGEDRRYTAMRNRAGASWWWFSLIKVFLLQGVLLWIIGMPVPVGLLSASTPTALPTVGFLGIAVFVVGLAFESVGDWQLARFKANPASRGAVMDQGLWRYTRHPNYFGDACVWWGIYLVATGVGAWWTIFGPAIMTFFLLRVSGVSLLERDIGDRRPAYADYVRRTSSFLPWWPSR
jgi:steroid 5-alpha reductase family enzyme